MTTTFRADARTSLHTLLDTFKTNNATLIRQVYKARPPDFGSCPCAYVGGITEPRIVHTSGVRQRDLELNIVVVDELQDNEETSGRIDVLTDALLDALTAAPHAVSALTVQQPVRVEAGELDVGGVIYAANVIVVSASIQEGRT
jgi:hypothetical protein